jgi:hypothetical protein
MLPLVRVFDLGPPKYRQGVTLFLQPSESKSFFADSGLQWLGWPLPFSEIRYKINSYDRRTPGGLDARIEILEGQH